MKNQEEIMDKINNYVNMLDKPENQTEVMEIKLYAYIDALNWVIRG